MARQLDYSEKYFMLKNGYKMRALGLGTKGMTNYQYLYNTIDVALHTGYRLFDTAAVYGHEKLLSSVFGHLLSKHGLVRGDIFITTKLAPMANDSKFVLKTFEKSLENLDTDNIDLHLLQFENCDPSNSKNEKKRTGTWIAISKLYDQSQIRAIGESNFNLSHLMKLADVMAVGPVVNQIEWHPYYYKSDILKYCTENNILIQAYSSIGGLSKRNTALMQDPVVKDIAKRYEMSTAQIMLMWSLQKGIVVIRNSKHPDLIMKKVHLSVQISQEDMMLLDALGVKNQKYGWDPMAVS